MAFATYSGPVRVGTVKEGSGRNTGLITLAQSGTVLMNGVAKTSGAAETALGITLPAGSKILDVIVEVTTTIAGNSISQVGVTLGKAGTADHFSASFNTGVTAARVAHAVVDAGLASKVANLANVGTADMPLYGTFTATTGNATSGAITFTVIYVQRDAAGNANPVSG